MGIAGQFDALRAAVNHNAAVLLAANNGISPAMIANRISISLAAEFSVGALWLSFVIDFLAECLMAVVAPIGAVVILAYLFNNRPLGRALDSQTGRTGVARLLVAIELKIVLARYQAEVGKIEGLSGSAHGGTQAIWMLWSLGRYSCSARSSWSLCLRSPGPSVAATLQRRRDAHRHGGQRRRSAVGCLPGRVPGGSECLDAPSAARSNVQAAREAATATPHHHHKGNRNEVSARVLLLVVVSSCADNNMH